MYLCVHHICWETWLPLLDCIQFHTHGHTVSSLMSGDIKELSPFTLLSMG